MNLDLFPRKGYDAFVKINGVEKSVFIYTETEEECEARQPTIKTITREQMKARLIELAEACDDPKVSTMDMCIYLFGLSGRASHNFLRINW